MGSAIPPRTVKELVVSSARWLEGRGVEEARLDAELLVAAALQKSRLGLWLVHDMPVDGVVLDRAREAIQRRGRGEPVAYILGEQEFHGHCFKVTRATLIPRPETEHLVDEALSLLPARADGLRPQVVDLGTGTGCIAISLALARPDLEVTAVDISADALAVAAGNAERLGAGIHCVNQDMFAFLAGAGGFDLVLSNPPYITEGERASLQREVRDWEPELALMSGEDPLRFHARLAAHLVTALKPRGHALMELPALDGVGLQRAKELGTGFTTRCVNDLAGIPRVLVLSRNAASGG